MIELGLAVGASVGWGASEFIAGFASRTRPMVRILVGSQLISLVLVAVMLPVTGFALPPAHAVALAAAAGLFEVLGVAALYRALATGPMGPVAPVAALGGLVPLSASLAGGGSLPTAAAIGIVLGLCGIVLVSWEGDAKRAPAQALTRPLLLAGAASIFFGFFFLLLQRATVESDAVAAVTVARVFAVATTLLILLVALRPRSGVRPEVGLPTRWRVDRMELAMIAGISALDVGANLLYAFGTSRSGDVGLQIIASASPVATVVLAGVVLRERMNAVQLTGVCLTLSAVLLIGGG